jgi:hypothetical protein
MRGTCRSNAEPAAVHQIAVTAVLEAHPMMEVAAAQMLIVLVEELRLTGVVVRQLRVELCGDDLSADHYGPIR